MEQVQLSRSLQAGILVHFMLREAGDVTGWRVMTTVEEDGLGIRFQNYFDTISSCKLPQVSHELCDVAHRFFEYLREFDPDYAAFFREDICALLARYDIECNRDEAGPCPKSMSWLRGDLRGFCFALANMLELWVREIN